MEILLGIARQGIAFLWRLLLGWSIFFALSLGALEAFDRLYDSSASFALSQAILDLRGNPSPLLEEAQVLSQRVSQETADPLLGLLRFGLSDRISSYGFQARFDPAAFRIALSPKLATLSPGARRIVILHEIGHAVAFARAYSPDVSSLKTPEARYIIAESLLARQIFHESFAETFAVAMDLRLFPRDPAAWGEIADALGRPPLRLNPAYDTFIALRGLNRRLGSISSLPPEALSPQILRIASESVPLAIAHLRGEREAACYAGARSMARFLLNYGYASPVFPWDMATTGKPQPGDPFFEGISELKALRAVAPPPHPLALGMLAPSFRRQALADAALPPEEAAPRLARGILLFSGSVAPVPEKLFAAWIERGLRRKEASPSLVSLFSSALLLADWSGAQKPLGCGSP